MEGALHAVRHRLQRARRPPRRRDLQADLEAGVRRGGLARRQESEYGWKEILPAAALQGAIFALVKAAVDRGGAQGFQKADRRLAGRLTADGEPMALEHEDERETVEAKREDRGAANGRAPDSPTDLGGTVQKDTLKRTFKEFSADNITDWAAALTYYGVLALFPAMIALVSIIGLIGPSATDPLLENVGKLAPGPAKDILTSAIENLAGNQGRGGARVHHRPGAGAELGLQLHLGASRRASNSIYDVEEGRPIWKLKPQQIGIALVLIVMLVLIAVAVTVSGPLAKEVGKVIGVGDTAATIWDIAKIPVILLLVSFMFAFLYWAAPNVKQPGFKFISPGGVVALVIWIVASLLFALYVATFASYNKTYGSLGGVVVFLVWMWITNIAILFGAEFNAELQRSQQREAGEAAPLDEPFLEPRDTSKLEKKAEK